MSVSAIILRAILQTAHLALWLRQVLRVMFVNTKRTLNYLLDRKEKSLDAIQAESRKLEKIPQHLGIIFQESDLCLESVATLLCWSFAAGVQYTSVYDPKRDLKRRAVELRSMVSQVHQKLFPATAPEVQVTCVYELSQANPTRESQVHSVLVLAPDDTRTDLVSSATQICELVVQGCLQPGSICPALISSTSQVSQCYPEPDLMLVLGETRCLLGYLPWMTRLTEILWFPSHHKIRYLDFASLLMTYAKCKRRFGK